MVQRVIHKLGRKLSGEDRRRLLQWLRRVRRPARMGLAAGTAPLSDVWGFDRGMPIDRYYIGRFLEEYRSDIHGRVLEVKESTYAASLGTGIERIDILDIDGHNPEATLVADLAAAGGITSDQFDCFVLTQTLQFIYEHEAAIRHARRMLRTGGVLLATVPSVSRLAPRYGIDNDYWRYTAASCRRLFGGVFAVENVVVRSYGNALAGTAFLSGMAVEDVSAAKLDVQDEYFPVLIGVRAIKR